MHNVLSLVAIQLSGMLGLNRFFHTRDRGAKCRMALLGGSIVLGVGAIVVGAALLCDLAFPVLALLGAARLVPPLLFAMASIICLITSVQTGAGALFDTRDVQILLPMPLHSRTIVAARLIGLYLIDLLIESILYVPVMVLYARHMPVKLPVFIPVSVLSLLALPVLPLLLGTALGTLVHAAAARFRHSNIVAMILLCLFTLGLLALQFSASFMTADSIDVRKILRITETITEMIVRVYPPTQLFAWAIGGSLGAGLALFALSLGAFVLAVCVLGRYYLPLHGLIGATATARRGVKRDVWRVRTPFAAMLAREGRRMLASPVYAMNTTFGLLLMVILSGALCLMGDRIFAILAVGDLAGLDLRAYARLGGAYILFLLTTMAPTTCVSISLEGAAFSGLRALPIRPRTLLTMKVVYNMLLMLPAVLLSAGLMICALEMTGVAAAACILLPLSGVVLAPSWGLIANLLFPRFDWKSETEVVKQGLSVLIGVLGSMLLTLGPMFALIYLGVDLNRAALWLALAYTLLGCGCWAVLLTWGEKRFARIG